MKTAELCRRLFPPEIAKRVPVALVIGIFCCGLTACRSAFVETTIRNDGDSPLRLIEVDYPSASFGTQNLAAHAIYHYRFKVQGSGEITLSFAGTDGKTHTSTGPALQEGQHGGLTIAIDPAGKVAWAESLSAEK
jgi:hypothetical protein